MITPIDKPTPNFRPGRRAPIEAIVLHCTEGSAEATISWFATPKSEVSSHYMVQQDGTVVQFVDEGDEAWANGRVDHPTAKLVIDRLPMNPNAYTISIEHEGYGDLTPVQRSTSLDLIREIASAHGIPLDRTHILGHHEIYSLKSCPGNLDVDKHVAALTGAPTPAPVPPAIPAVVYSPSLGQYLVVARYVSDDEWYFVPIHEVVGGQRAGTALSKMPLHP